jgi:hypothetical protein
MNVGLMSVVDELGGHQYFEVCHIRIFLGGQSHPPTLIVSFLSQIMESTGGAHHEFQLCVLLKYSLYLHYVQFSTWFPKHGSSSIGTPMRRFGRSRVCKVRFMNYNPCFLAHQI